MSRNRKSIQTPEEGQTISLVLILMLVFSSLFIVYFSYEKYTQLDSDTLSYYKINDLLYIGYSFSPVIMIFFLISIFYPKVFSRLFKEEYLNNFNKEIEKKLKNDILGS